MRPKAPAGTRSGSHGIGNSNTGVFVEFYIFQNIFSFIFSFDGPQILSYRDGNSYSMGILSPVTGA